MCGVTEYEELPVRHNEDVLNMRLSTEVLTHSAGHYLELCQCTCPYGEPGQLSSGGRCF